MTDRVRAGAVAAVEYALGHSAETDVLEVTHNLGSIEGTWALVYDRRETLYAKHDKTVLKAWRAWIANLDTADLVAQYRRTAGLAEADTTTQDRRREREAAALLALQRLAADTDDAAYRDLVDSVEAALRDAEAEGRVGAIVVAADKLDHARIDMTAAHSDAVADLAQAERLTAQAEKAVVDMIGGAATDVGRALVASDDGSAEGDQGAVDDTLSNGRAAAAYTDWSIGTAILAGAVGAWAVFGATLVDWITAGDTKVCAICQGYEDNSPYSMFEVPAVPHPGCRCSTDAEVTSLGRFAQYLLGDSP